MREDQISAGCVGMQEDEVTAGCVGIPHMYCKGQMDEAVSMTGVLGPGLPVPYPFMHTTSAVTPYKNTYSCAEVLVHLLVPETVMLSRSPRVGHEHLAQEVFGKHEASCRA